MATTYSKICCSLNYAPHYRKEIFLKMEALLECDFYFGNKTFTPIKKIDYSLFKNNVVEFPFVSLCKNFYYLKGQLSLSSLHYTHYIITGQPFNLTDWGLLILNKIKRKKTYIWNHGWYGNEGFVKKILKKLQVWLCSGYLLYGDYAKKMMVQEGFPKEKLFVIYNSLSYQDQLNVRNKLEHSTVYRDYFKNQYPTVIFIGRITKAKKLDLLIEAMELSFAKKTFFNLILVGDGTEKDTMINLVDQKGLSSFVWFYGGCYDERKIGELIHQADLCVSPGNIGLTAIHSLTFGTPAITHSNFANQGPEFEALEEGKTGTFFKENDANSLQETMEQWLKKYPSKEDWLKVHCYEKIDRYYNPMYQISLLKKLLLENSSN